MGSYEETLLIEILSVQGVSTRKPRKPSFKIFKRRWCKVSTMRPHAHSVLRRRQMGLNLETSRWRGEIFHSNLDDERFQHGRRNLS